MKKLVALMAPFALSACAELAANLSSAPSEPEPEVMEAPPEEAAPAPLDQTEIETRAAPASARTAEQFDTTTEEERAAAAAPPERPAAAGPLGTTIATLGDPTEQGFWLKTPLVTSERAGRVVYGANGKAAQVELRPSGGERGSGSQISLAAMRVLEAPLTELIELQVFPE